MKDIRTHKSVQRAQARADQPSFVDAGVLQSLEAEYRKMLAYRTTDDLLTIAETRGIDLADTRRDSIIEELAIQLSDPQAIRAEILSTDEMGQGILAYLHLVLTPGHGLSAENIVNELSERHEYQSLGQLELGTRFERGGRFGHTLSATSELFASSAVRDGSAESPRSVRVDPTRNVKSERQASGGGYTTPQNVHPRRTKSLIYDRRGHRDRRAIYNQIAALSRRGLLLSFKQNHTICYSVPLAVRACLHPLPDLIPAYEKIELLQIRETSSATLIRKLYDLWDAIAVQSIPKNRRGHSRRATDDQSGHLLRSAAPPRQPVEDQWPPLQGWNHLPSELKEIARRRLPRARPSYHGDRGSSVGSFSHPVTISTPAYRLRSADRAALRDRTACTDEELEFYYVLLEGMGAIAGEPGQPIILHKETIQRFLSLSPSTQMRTIYHTYEANTAWSEMDIVLRSVDDDHAADRRCLTSPHQRLRLRRNLLYTDYKATDLYREWRAGRLAVLRFLSTLKENCWVSPDAFLAALFEINPNLLHTLSATSVWWLESLKTKKQFGTTFDDWRQSHGQFVLAALEGPLVWLGIVSLGYQDDRLEAFKLTDIGAFVLGRRSTLRFDPSPGGEYTTPQNVRSPAFQADETRPTEDIPEMAAIHPICSFGDDLTITLVPNYVPVQLHDLLRSIGKLEEVTPERFVYRITADGVRQWTESSVSANAADGRHPRHSTHPAQPSTHEGQETPIEALIALLNELCRADRRHPSAVDAYVACHAQTGVPAAWQEKLRTWSQNYGKLHVYEDITLIELADDYALQELIASTLLSKYLIYQFSPRLIAIQPDAVDILVQEMEKRGYTPRMV